MRRVKQWVVLCAVAAGALSSNASAWTYDDTTNEVLISGAACRAANGTDEAKVNHLPGMTTVKSNAGEVRLYCPLARRNLDVYDTEISNENNLPDVKLNGIWVYVNRASANVECRLFGKDATSGSVQYSAWFQPFSWYNLLFLDVNINWDSYSWGLQCDVGANESIYSIYTPVTYTTN